MSGSLAIAKEPRAIVFGCPQLSTTTKTHGHHRTNASLQPHRHMRVQSDEATLRDINTSSPHRLSSLQPAKPRCFPRSALRVLLVANMVLNVALVLLPLYRPLLRKNGVRYLSTRLHHQSDRLRGLCRSNLRKLAVSSSPHDRLPSHSNTATSGITLAPSNFSAALLIRDGPARRYPHRLRQAPRCFDPQAGH
jgi:hypothetical protein